MKHLIYLLLIAATCFIGCSYDNGNDKSIKGEINGLYDLKVIIIDGCEYFKYRTYMGYLSITHKGNCNNPIHNQ